MVKRLVIAILLLGLVATAIVGFNLFRDRAISDFFANRPVPTVNVATARVEAGPWTPGIEAIGTILAGRGIDLALEAGGVVREVTFRSNERVEAGDLLVQIDDAIERADLAAAEAAVSVAESQLERIRTLSDRGVSAAASLEETEANAASARSQISRLNAILDQKALRAPFSGTIGIPQVEEGEFVAAGTVVATLQDLETLRADFSIPEQLRPLLEIGLDVEIGAETGGEAALGRIVAIEPRIDPRTRLVQVRAELTDPGARFHPGQFVRIRVILPEEPDTLTLPQSAVVQSLYGDYVYAVREDENGEGLVARQVFVTAGRRAGDRVEIIDGLSAGEIVVSAGQNRLSNGTPVTLDEREADDPAAMAGG